MKPVTVPSIVNVPCGEGKLWNGIVQVIVFRTCAALAAVLWSVIVVPPVGVNVRVKLNAVGMKTEVLPMMWAGVKSPLPLVTTVSVCVPQTARNWSAFFA